MPLYRGKTTIQALGGDRIEWKAKFECRENAAGTGSELVVTAPPCEIPTVNWITGLPARWSIKVKARGEVVLEGFDVAYQDPDPPVFRGFIAVQWDQESATANLGRVNWGGGGAPALAPGDSVLLTLWLRNTAIPTDYSLETA